MHKLQTESVLSRAPPVRPNGLCIAQDDRSAWKQAQTPLSANAPLPEELNRSVLVRGWAASTGCSLDKRYRLRNHGRHCTRIYTGRPRNGKGCNRPPFRVVNSDVSGLHRRSNKNVRTRSETCRRCFRKSNHHHWRSLACSFVSEHRMSRVHMAGRPSELLDIVPGQTRSLPSRST